jgi:hypothetical protein
MELKRKLLVAIFGLLATGAVCSTASAETRWERNHPRQEQVLHRVALQRHDIRKERREGELTHGEAHRLQARDTRVARQDHRMARANGGFITKAEQHRLNRQENHIHRHIPA